MPTTSAPLWGLYAHQIEDGTALDLYRGGPTPVTLGLADDDEASVLASLTFEVADRLRVAIGRELDRWRCDWCERAATVQVSSREKASRPDQACDEHAEEWCAGHTLPFTGPPCRA